jgi:hypothetical protein
MSTPDPELDRVRRAFDGVYRRISTVTTDADFEDELSNLLCQLYRLGGAGQEAVGPEVRSEAGQAEVLQAVTGLQRSPIRSGHDVGADL